tara:strand:+ start:3650 stop:4243 length:594 start_codon:yes stop_codon:yes gene_type:complete
MFTGIIEEIGKVSSIDKLDDMTKLTIKTSNILASSKIGDSISINGTCLTITSIKGKLFTSDIVKETIDRTNIQYLKTGDSVNLERAMRADSRFDGHIVQGHIEGVGKVEEIKHNKESIIIKIKIPDDLIKYCIQKGSIAINGTSLTIAMIKENLIDIWIIPHTLTHTTFGTINESDYVNIETDILAKYIEKLNKVNN